MSHNKRSVLVVLFFAAMILTALPVRAGHQNYVQKNLVSDGAVTATTIDPNLKTRGVSHSASRPA